MSVTAGLLLTGSAFSNTQPDNAAPQFNAVQLTKIENGLLFCLASGCAEIRAAAALTIKRLKELAPEYSFRRSIIPLMRIVKDEGCDPRSRIAASYALHALESERGDYAIKMTGHFSEVGPVKRACKRLSLARAAENTALR